jgi:hypothetical protein
MFHAAERRNENEMSKRKTNIKNEEPDTSSEFVPDAGTDKTEQKSDARKSKKRTGRPYVNIDKDEFEKLCSMQCTQEEICGWFGIDENSVNAWCKRNYNGRSFSEIFKEKRQGGKCSLRRKQWLMADTNAAMAIFLGKNILGQSDDPARSRAAESAEGHLAKFISALSDVIQDGE